MCKKLLSGLEGKSPPGPGCVDDAECEDPPLCDLVEQICKPGHIPIKDFTPINLHKTRCTFIHLDWYKWGEIKDTIHWRGVGVGKRLYLFPFFLAPFPKQCHILHNKYNANTMLQSEMCCNTAINTKIIKNYCLPSGSKILRHSDIFKLLSTCVI